MEEDTDCADPCGGQKRCFRYFKQIAFLCDGFIQAEKCDLIKHIQLLHVNPSLNVVSYSINVYKSFIFSSHRSLNNISQIPGPSRSAREGFDEGSHLELPEKCKTECTR